MKCSVIIRTLNESRYLPQLLKGLSTQSLPRDEIEIVVVDSGSTDGTIDIANRFGARILHITREEFSFGRSLNRGCEAATGEFLVLVSGHCVPADGQWLERLMAPFIEDSVAITYGRQLAGPETRWSEKQLFENYFPGNAAEPPNAFFCNNANAAIRKSIWEQYGYDEGVTGLEDMLLGKQVVADGHQVRYCHTASVFHYHHESWSQIRRRFEREALALQQIMPEIQVTLLDALRYWTAGILGDWSGALASKCFLKHGLAILQYRTCQYFGVWRGNRSHRNLSRQAKDRYFYPSRSAANAIVVDAETTRQGSTSASTMAHH